MSSVLVIYCCITDYPHILWIKTTTILLWLMVLWVRVQAGLAERFWYQLRLLRGTQLACGWSTGSEMPWLTCALLDVTGRLSSGVTGAIGSQTKSTSGPFPWTSQSPPRSCYSACNSLANAACMAWCRVAWRGVACLQLCIQH